MPGFTFIFGVLYFGYLAFWASKVEETGAEDRYG